MKLTYIIDNPSYGERATFPSLRAAQAHYRRCGWHVTLHVRADGRVLDQDNLAIGWEVEKQAGYVRNDDGDWAVQLPASNQWGFILCDEDQSYPGGFGSGLEDGWFLVPASKVPRDIRKRLGWILAEHRAGEV